MFEKSKRSIVAATRGGTYRIWDSAGARGQAGASSHGGGHQQDDVDLSRSKISRGRFHGGISAAGNKVKHLAITVIFLDDSQHTFEVEKSAKGSVLLDKVYEHLELIERDYFGLQFDELLPPPEVIHPLSSPHLRWIESSKQLKKQIRFAKPYTSTSSNNTSTKKSSSIGNVSEKSSSKKVISNEQSANGNILPTATVYFRVKFFVEDPSRLNEEYTRYHVFLQLRKDILEGRLIITPSTACLLASYAVQSELGDFNSEEHDELGFYLRNTEANLLLVGGEEDCLRKISQLHQLHRGQTPADAEFNFLAHAKRLDTYGVNFHRVKDNLGKEILLGISSMGISVHHNGVKINTFSWSKITKIAFKRKHFFIQLRRELSEEYDTLLLFDCWSYRSCKRLWKSCVEHHAFFRLSAPPPPNRRPTLLFLALGSRFRYSGRTEYQTKEDASSRSASRERSRERRTNFFRSPSKKLLLLRQTLSGNRNGRSQERRVSRQDNNEENNREEMNFPARRESKSQDRGGGGVEFHDKENLEGGMGRASYPQLNTSLLGNAGRVGGDGILVAGRGSGGAVKGGNVRAYDKVHITSANEKEPRQAWAEQNLSDETGVNGQQQMTSTTPGSTPIPIALLAKGIAFADDDDNSTSDDGTVSIRLEPDTQGKFGFNVKGGCDMGCPVLVSRVAPGTPADQGYPRLNEGDQLIQINGMDTVLMSHRDIVTSIRHAATVRKELQLRVRQNVYTTEDFEEPPFQYVPDVPLLHMVTGSDDPGIQTALSSSMLLLAEALDSDSISRQFELIFRRKPGMSCEVSKMPENLNKNRYRDITPYDSTRVVMHGSPSGDYINANYVTMEIAASGIVNRYIATQGPLSTTTNDFWIMVWETQSPLIVMLTPIYEHGRVKCHPYWPPHVNSPVVYHNLQVTMIQERSLPLWIHREFHIKHLETDEERVVVQLMYQNWPDHGVPDEPLSFIRFMEEVRKLRLGTVEPTIVHCSAGIGRTGVLILMETAECLIEANQPVYPLDIVTQMRLQRPLMIQTPSQYRFVCECVLNVYQKGMIRPLPEFSSSVQGNSPPSSAAQQQQLLSNNSSSDCRSRSHNFCSSTNTTSWFHNNLHQQQLHAGINA